jgi:hypothetical protein
MPDETVPESAGLHPQTRYLLTQIDERAQQTAEMPRGALQADITADRYLLGLDALRAILNNRMRQLAREPGWRHLATYLPDPDGTVIEFFGPHATGAPLPTEDPVINAVVWALGMEGGTSPQSTAWFTKKYSSR